MRLFFTARVISWLGTTMTLVALPVLGYQMTGSATVLGAIAAVEALPYLVLGLPAGALVDGWDTRWTLVVASLLSGLALGSLPLASALGLLGLAWLLVASGLAAAAFVFFDAACFAALPALVPAAELGPVNARLNAAYTGLAAGAPAVAGLLLGVWSPEVLIAFDAASYGVAAAALYGVRVARDRASGTVRARIGGGLQFILGSPVIRTLTVIGAANSLAMGAVGALVVVVAVEQLDLAATDSRVGLLFSASALGGLVGGLAVPRLQRHLPVGWVTTGGLAAGAMAVAAWSMQAGFIGSCVALAGVSAAAMVVVLHGIVVRQALTPLTMQARVNTTARMIAWGGTPLGAALGGFLADRYGVGPTLLGSAALLGLAAAACFSQLDLLASDVPLPALRSGS